MELINKHSNNNALQKRQNSLPSTVSSLREKYPDIVSFGTAFHPNNTERFSAVPTRCLTGSAPTLTDLRLAYSGSAHIQWLIAHLATFQEKLSVPNKMNTYELETCAQTLYDSYHYLKTTEIMLFLARLLGGMYPVDWHGYVTPTKLVSALRDYFIPWRNNLLYKIEKQERERKEKEEAAKPAITWDDYCKETGTDPDRDPLKRIKNTLKL